MWSCGWGQTPHDIHSEGSSAPVLRHPLARRRRRWHQRHESRKPRALLGLGKNSAGPEGIRFSQSLQRIHRRIAASCGFHRGCKHVRWSRSRNPSLDHNHIAHRCRSKYIEARLLRRRVRRLHLRIRRSPHPFRHIAQRLNWHSVGRRRRQAPRRPDMQTFHGLRRRHDLHDTSAPRRLSSRHSLGQRHRRVQPHRDE